MKMFGKTGGIISVICLFFVSLCAGISLVIGSFAQKPDVIFADQGGQGLYPTIYAQPFDPSINSDMGYGGKLEINGIPWSLDGSYYNAGSIGSTVYVRAIPEAHFEIDESNVFQISYQGDGGQVYEDVSISDFTGGYYAFEVQENKDYLFKVNFKPVKYSLTFSTEYYNGSPASYKTTGDFNISVEGQAENTLVGWGDNIVFDNNITPRQDGRPYGTYDNGNLQDGTGVRFAYVMVKYMDGAKTRYDILTDVNGEALGSLSLGENLTDYVTNINDTDTIEIIGVYAKVNEVEVVSSLSASENLITIAAVEPGKQVKILYGAGIYYFDEGTELTIFAADNQYYNFGGFDIAPGSDLTTYSVESLVNNLKITVYHDVAEYTLYLRGLKISYDATGSEVIGDEFDVGEALTISKNGHEKITSNTNGTAINAFNSLSNPCYDESLDNYRFTGDYLVKAGDGYDIFDESIIFDSSSISKYVDQNGLIFVVAELVEQFALNVIVNDSEAQLGQVKVTYEGTSQSVDLNDKIDMGRAIRIEASANNEFVAFLEIGGIADQYFVTDAKDTAVITMLSDRTIYPRFSPKTLALNSEQEGFEFYCNEVDGLKVNDVVYFSYKEEGDIASWKINGIEITEFKDASGKKYIEKYGNSIEITLSPGFLEMLANNNSNAVRWNDDKFSITIDNEVELAANIGTLLLIVIPSVLAVASLAFALVFVAINSKRKKLIKAQLVEKRQEGIKRNVGGYISDLRSGSITGDISKEDIKKEMKKQKTDKTKPSVAIVSDATPAVAVTRVPAMKGATKTSVKTPAKQNISEVLVGGAIKPDRTVVGKDKNVIGIMQKDGSIVDANGKVVAKVRLDNGTIVDLGGDVIGSVTGKGTIVKSEN